MAKQNPHIKAFLASITPEYVVAALDVYAEKGHGYTAANCKWIAYDAAKNLDPDGNRYAHDSGYNHDDLVRSLAAKFRRVLVKLADDDASPVELRGWGKRQSFQIVSAEERAEQANAMAAREERIDFVEKAAAKLGVDLDYSGRGSVEIDFAVFQKLMSTILQNK